MAGDHQIWAGALVVEHRFAGDVVAGMLAKELEVR
jgi:hypothetical protein